MKFNRKQAILPHLFPHRVLIIYGPRRVGKTTLLKKYLTSQADKKVFYATGDDITLRRLFGSEEQKQILDFARPYEIIGIDEAQQIAKIGIGAKIIIDAFPEKILILTGSSSFDLSREIGEPLTGRHFTLSLYPLAQVEMEASTFELKNHLEDFLIYGSYPEVLLEPDNSIKVKILTELVSSYLFKDVLALDRIRSPDLLLDIVKCLAFQVGSEVSQSEIATTVKTDPKTVGRYLDLLEKMFVIKRVRAFSRNLRNEISKKAKYYFLDNGVRNAVIASFNPLSSRDDVGKLWKNFVYSELLKQSAIADKPDNYYFWRTHTGQEIDLIKEQGTAVEAIECKWSAGKIAAPTKWRQTYPEAIFRAITKDDYPEAFLLWLSLIKFYTSHSLDFFLIS